MALSKLVVAPDSASYSVADGNEALSVSLDGGASKYRRDIIGATSRVNCRWTLSKEEYFYFRAFYNTTSAKGSLPFLIDLLMDQETLTEHEAYFITGSVRLQQQRGLTFYVNAQLEVKPIPPDDDFNQSIVDLIESYGDLVTVAEVLNQLEQLVNVDLPGSLS